MEATGTTKENRYQVKSHITGEIRIVHAPSAQEACELCGWLIGNCWVKELPLHQLGEGY